jgi:hypothetical protein
MPVIDARERYKFFACVSPKGYLPAYLRYGEHEDTESSIENAIMAPKGWMHNFKVRAYDLAF